MGRIRRKLFYTYANLDLPIQWQDEQVATWASGKSISTRRDCMAVGSSDVNFCNNKSLKTFPELKWFTGIKDLSGSAFYGCSSLTSISIPDGVTSIGGWAFMYCSSLTSITLPDTLTSIGDSAFYSCRSLTSIELPDKLTSIGNNAFMYCSSLTSISIPDGVTSIAQNAFMYCRSLASISIPDGVTEISDCAFMGCTKLASVKIPSKLKAIGVLAFYGCTSLTKIRLKAATPPAITSNTFTATAEFYVPDDAVDTYKAASGWSDYASRIHPMSECPSE